jgi:DNA-binding PadR family transcriptional regulator
MDLTEAKVNILREIQDEPLHGYALADRLGVRGSTIYEHLESLEVNGYLESEEKGRRNVYHLTEKSELILKADDLD